MKRWLAAAAGVASFAAMTGSAQAQTCAGFEDVFTSETAVCPAVEWVRNRSITLGCSGTTQYCPGGNVTRAQMALFMKRLGEALSPNVLLRQHAFDGFTVPPDNEPGFIVCVTGELPPKPHPRQVTVNGGIGLQASAQVNFRTFILVNDGVSWQNFYPQATSPEPSVAQRGTAVAGGWGTTSMTEWGLLAPNVTYRFALGIRRDTVVPSASNAINAGRCQITAAVSSISGTASPY